MRTWRYWPGGNEFAYYYDDHPDLDNKLLILKNEDLVKEITCNSVDRYVLSERLAEYLWGAVKGSELQSAEVRSSATEPDFRFSRQE